MELFRVGDFRVAQITKLIKTTKDGVLTSSLRPIEEGVGIEKACFDGSWYVIAFLRPNEKEYVINIEPVGFRMIEIVSDDVEAFQDVFFEGCRVVMEALAAENDKWKEVYDYVYPQD